MLLSSSDQVWKNQKETKPKKGNKHFDHFFLMLTLKTTQLKLPKIQLVVSPPEDANHHYQFKLEIVKGKNARTKVRYPRC